jgi:hypothetical protein
VVRMPCRIGLSQTPPPDGDQMDSSGRTGANTRRLDTGRVDTRRSDAGSQTTNPCDWTPDGLDTGRAGQPGPDDGTGWVDTALDADADRRHGWRPGIIENGA